MAIAIIIFCYFWSFAFFILAIYFLLKSENLTEKLIGATIFGNSFSLIFWITTVISKLANNSIFATPIIVIFATISILFLILYIGLIAILKVKPQKYYSSYPN